MNPKLEIFSQGEEIVTGQIVDSNAAWLSQQAVTMGFTVTRHTAVGDKLTDLVQLLIDISKRADCCICTGGLGPTSDDLTAEAVARAFNLPLQFDEVAFRQIEQFFRNRNRQMPECNRKQAMLPQGATRLDNCVGTAPGFALQAERCWFAFVPGVPSEMRHLFEEHVQAMLVQRFTLQPRHLVTIKTIGIGESDLQERIDKVEIPPQVQLGFRAELGEVQIKLLFPSDYPLPDRQVLTEVIAKLIGDPVYAIDSLENQSGDLVRVLNQLMTAKNHKLAVVETISQGLLAAKLVGVSWLLSVIYEQMIEKLLRRYDVEPTHEDWLTSVKDLAFAIQKNTGADMVLIQIVSDDYYVKLNNHQSVTVTNLLLVEGQFKLTTRDLAGDIKRKQHQATLSALDLLRGHLQGKKAI